MLEAARDRAIDVGGDGKNLKRAEKNNWHCLFIFSFHFALCLTPN